MPTLQVSVVPTVPLPKEATATLSLFLHDKQLACAEAGTAGQAHITIPAHSLEPVRATFLADLSTVNQNGRTVSEMIRPSFYLSLQSDSVVAADVPGYGDGAPYFDVILSEVLHVTVKPRE